MRKICAVIILAATLLSFAGCGAKDAELEPTTVPTRSGITRKEVLDSFEMQLAESDLSDYYRTTRLPETELPENGDIYQAVVVTDKQEGYTYHLGAYSSAEGDVYRVFMDCRDDGLSGLAFPTFCLYVVNALEIEVDGFELSEDLNLFGEPSGSVTAFGWELSALSVQDILTFSAEFITE